MGSVGQDVFVNRHRIPVVARKGVSQDPFSIDQTKPAHGTNGFQSLGQFRFAAHEKATVLYRMAGARGTVHIDAVQVIPMK